MTPFRLVVLSFCLTFGNSLHSQKASAPEQAPSPAQSFPSRAEIDELTAKASEKVHSFQKALDEVKPLLDKADPSAYAKHKEAADTSQMSLDTLKKNGPSAYALVSLLTTLDDLNLDASQDTTSLLIYQAQTTESGKPSPSGTLPDIMILTSAATGLYDISELVMHATLRFVSVEEATLGALLDEKK